MLLALLPPRQIAAAAVVQAAVLCRSLVLSMVDGWSAIAFFGDLEG
jgi:hypothetical protein